MVSWAFFMWKQSGRLVKEPTWKEWLAAHPDMEIVAVDQTDPNPTDAAVSDAS
jgi:hypothetical protein